MTAPLVSIIIPCYNAEAWVAQTLESALSQTWPNKEVLVINDGSNDASLEVVRRFAFRGVQVVTQPNEGAAAARNHGLRLARGDFIQFLDADDLLAADKIERQIRLLQAVGDDCIVCCAWSRFSSDPATALPDPHRELWQDLAPVEWFVLAAEHNRMMATATWLLPRAIVARIGPWDTTYRSNPLDDMDYFDRARAVSRRVLFCAGTQTFYRSALPGSLSQVRTDEAWRAMHATLHRSADRLLQLEDSPRTRHATATMLQRFIYECYPAVPELAAVSAARVRQLGGTNLKPEFGPARRRLASLLGWKLTKRLHMALRP